MSVSMKSPEGGENSAGAQPQTVERKVVIHTDSGEVIKGFLSVPASLSLEAALDAALESNPQTITVRPLQADDLVSVSWENVKAVFFVKSFQGNSARRDIRFNSNRKEVGRIQAEVLFNDNEVIEGTIDNSVRHILDHGILLSPSDPNSNNLLVYANKAAVTNYKVLGVREYREPKG